MNSEENFSHLVLVRHGQSEWNAKNLFTGWKNPGLTKKGLEEGSLDPNLVEGKATKAWRQFRVSMDWPRSDEDKFYLEFIKKLDLHLEDLPNRADKSNWPRLKDIFQNIIKTKTMREWEKVYFGTDACVAPVLNFEEAFVDPHNKYRGIFPEAFNIIQPKPAPDLSVTPAPKITDKHKIKLTEAELFNQWDIK